MSRSTSSSLPKFAPFAQPGRTPRHSRTPRVSVSRSIFALIDDRDFAYLDEEVITRIRSDTSTGPRGQSSAAPTLLSWMC